MDLVRNVPQQDFDRLLRAVGDKKEDWNESADSWKMKDGIKAAGGAQVARRHCSHRPRVVERSVSLAPRAPGRW